MRLARRTTARVLRNRADVLAVISVGGAVGSLARWGLTLVWPVRVVGFPIATCVANVTGCMALGVLMVFVLNVLPPSRYARPFLGVGVLGGFTTFSSAMLDTRAQLIAGHHVQAGGYLFGSVFAGLVAVWLGMVLARAAVAVVRGLARRRRRGPSPAPTFPVPAATSPTRSLEPAAGSTPSSAALADDRPSDPRSS